ncbi:attachment protein [Tatumella sp. JGM130]|uniref:attachment protein n=1 Tax=Tatumella sp. JGM130 TaxID=2799797 RepID=UPI001BB0996D|nr:attachment protein [Tatumella sp. JGM130]MBS0895408.1 attachment protein [Tatumella sp. JGM130]MBS0895420.1 attachment protein [Tatumella sp. JGM130]
MLIIRLVIPLSLFVSFYSYSESELYFKKDYLTQPYSSYSVSTGLNTVTQSKIDEACQKSLAAAKKDIEGRLSKLDANYVDSYSDCDTSAVKAGTYPRNEVIPSVFVTGFIFHFPEDSSCDAAESMTGTFNNVYGSRTYINYNGCQYESSGVIVCDNAGTTCSADWKPTGQKADPAYGNATADDGSQNGSGEDNNTGNNSGGSNTDTGGNNSNGTVSLDEKQVARAVTTGIKDATPELSKSISTGIRDELTELDTSKNDQTYADDKTKSNLAALNNNIGDLVRGVGRYVDPADNGTKYGEGTSSMDLAVSNASEYDISNDSHGAMWESFLNDSALRPKIPTGNGCSDFIMFSGTVYQIDIGCDKLQDIKSMLTWIMYCLTFWYAFTSLTSLLRKGE